MAISVLGTRTSSQGTNSTTHTVTLPNGSNISGRRVVVLVGVDSTTAVTWPAGWTRIGTGTTTDTRFDSAYRDIDGTEGFDGTDDTIQFTTTGSEQSDHHSYLITGHEPTQAPQFTSPSTGTGTSPNPPGHDSVLVRAFDGTDDDIVRSIGGLSGMTYGTVVTLLKRAGGAEPETILGLNNNTPNTVAQFWFDDPGDLALYNGIVTRTSTVVGLGDWVLIFMWKDSGSVTGRTAVFDFTAGTWTHADFNGTSADWSSPGAGGTVDFSSEFDEFFQGWVVAQAVWANSAPFTSDLAVERAGLHERFGNWIDVRAAEVGDNFNSYTQGNTLATENATDWDVWDEVGGEMTLDQHDDHSDGSLVVDMSSTGTDWAVYQTQVSSADHYAEVDCFVDSVADDQGSPPNQAGPIVRGNQAAIDGAPGATFDGYMAQLERIQGAVFPDPAETRLRIYRIDDRALTMLAESADISGQSYDGSASGAQATIRLEIEGDALTAYSNGVELASTTDSTYTTGTFVGVRMRRGITATDSQPFFDNFTSGAIAGNNPDALWHFGQDQTADDVTDLTGNGADQSSITGTSVVANDGPPGFAMFENLWIAAAATAGAAAGTDFTNAPAGYTGLLSSPGGSAQAPLGSAHRILEAGTENPGPFAVDNGSAWIATTIVVLPSLDEAGEVTGSLAETQDDQTLAGAGSAEILGTLTQTQDDQTLTATGDVEALGSLAETQDDQTLTGSGFIGNVGTLAETQEDQALAASGVIGITGTLAETQDDQTLAGTGSAVSGDEVDGTLNLTQEDQALVGVGAAEATGSLSEAQESQVLVASGWAEATGALSVSQESQVLVASGFSGIPVQPVDLRPQRRILGSRLFPVTWPPQRT